MPLNFTDQDSSYLYTAGTADADDDYTLDMLDESCDDDLSSIPSIMLVDRVNRHRSSAVQEEEGKQEEHSFNSSNVLMRQGKVLRRQSELTNKQQTLGFLLQKFAIHTFLEWLLVSTSYFLVSKINDTILMMSLGAIEEISFIFKVFCFQK